MMDRGPGVPPDHPSLSPIVPPDEAAAGIRAAVPDAAPYGVADGPSAGMTLTGSVGVRYLVSRASLTDPTALTLTAYRRHEYPAFDPAAFPAVRGFYDLDGSTAPAVWRWSGY